VFADASVGCRSHGLYLLGAVMSVSGNFAYYSPDIASVMIVYAYYIMDIG
jgi:hypothetical protein